MTTDELRTNVVDLAARIREGGELWRTQQRLAGKLGQDFLDGISEREAGIHAARIREAGNIWRSLEHMVGELEREIFDLHEHHARAGGEPGDRPAGAVQDGQVAAPETG